MIKVYYPEKLAKETEWISLTNNDIYFIFLSPIFIPLAIYAILFILIGFDIKILYIMIFSIIVVYLLMIYLENRMKYTRGYVWKIYDISFLKDLEHYLRKKYQLDQSLDYIYYISHFGKKQYKQYSGYHDEISQLNIIIGRHPHALPEINFTLRIGKVTADNYKYANAIIKEIEKRKSSFSRNNKK